LEAKVCGSLFSQNVCTQLPDWNTVSYAEDYNIKLSLIHSQSQYLVYKNTDLSSATYHIRIHLHMTETTYKNTTKKRVTNIVIEILVRCQVTTSKNIPILEGVKLLYVKIFPLKVTSNIPNYNMICQI
jgi:hypothetical protein